MMWFQTDTYIEQVMTERYGDSFLGMAANGFVYRGINERDIRLDEITVNGVPATKMEKLDPIKNRWHVRPMDKINSLIPDIEKNGLNRPVWVDANNDFVQGIHRLWAHILLGKDTIRCFTIVDADKRWGE